MSSRVCMRTSLVSNILLLGPVALTLLGSWSKRQNVSSTLDLLSQKLSLSGILGNSFPLKFERYCSSDLLFMAFSFTDYIFLHGQKCSSWQPMCPRLLAGIWTGLLWQQTHLPMLPKLKLSGL